MMEIRLVNIIIAIILFLFYIITSKKIYKLDVENYNDIVAKNLSKNRWSFNIAFLSTILLVDKIFIFIISYIVLYLTRTLIDGKILIEDIKNKQ